tara:strand:- start:822 stop:1391 length:570 start_codon:yes stop_codon:yes gene_type:complete
MEHKLLSALNIKYTVDTVPYSDIFTAISTACTFLDSEHSDSLKEKVFLQLKDYHVDIESHNIFSKEFLDLIGQILEDVRIFLVYEQHILGGGCNKKKFKHRIFLLVSDEQFYIVRLSNRDEQYIDRKLNGSGIYRYSYRKWIIFRTIVIALFFFISYCYLVHKIDLNADYINAFIIAIAENNTHVFETY